MHRPAPRRLRRHRLALGLSLLATSAVAAPATPSEPPPAGKVSALAADETQQTYARKAALATTDIGLTRATIAAPVRTCTPRGRDLVCDGAGVWRYRVGPERERRVAEELYDWIITQRFDQIRVHGTTARLRTAQSETRVEVPQIAGFGYGEGSLSAFKTMVERWLGQRLGQAMGTVLSDAAQARYAELPDRERGAFIESHARSLGMPVEIVDRLMRSAFAFFVHVDISSPGVSIVRTTRTVTRNGKSREVPDWQVSVSVAVDAQVLIYSYDPETDAFALYRLLNQGSGGAISSSKSFARRPSQRETEALFEDSLMTATRAAGVALNTSLKADENFAIVFVADAVDGSQLDGDVGVVEDIRVDAPAIVTRNVDGVDVQVGFVKARRVSHNCTERAPSQFELVGGTSEPGDRVREHPWTGLLGRASFGTTQYSLARFGGREARGGGTFAGPRVGAELDLGFAANAPALSEIWLDLDIGFGVSLEEKGFEALSGAQPSMLSLDAGLSRRVYLASSGLYLAPAVDVGVISMSASGNEADEDDITHSITAFAVTPELRLGFNLSPDIELVGQAGWTLPLGAGGSRTVGEGEPEDVSVQVEGGLRAGVMVSFHLPVVGPMARLYAKPSSVCRQAPMIAEPRTPGAPRASL